MVVDWKKDGDDEAYTRRLYASDIEVIFKAILDNCYRMWLDPPLPPREPALQGAPLSLPSPCPPPAARPGSAGTTTHPQAGDIVSTTSCSCPS
jgi:hypothetical protein